MTLASRPFIFNIAITLVVLFLFTACVSANIATNIIDRSSNSTQQLVTRQNNGYANITAYLHNIRGMDFSTSCSKSAGNDMTQCDFYFNPNKLAYWEQPTVCVIYGYIRPMRDLEACIMQVPENPCLMKYMDWLQQCARDIYFAGTTTTDQCQTHDDNSLLLLIQMKM